MSIIDDSYNANYESMVAAIDYLNTFNNYKIIIVGEIAELGKFSNQIHLKIANICVIILLVLLLGLAIERKFLKRY